MYTRNLLWLVSLVSAAPLYAADVPANTPLAPQQVFRYNNHSDPGTLDPQKVEENTAAQIVLDLFEGLVWMDGEGQVQPAQAERWEILDGGKRYIFHLRSGLQWSDGQPLTAEDFVLGWQRAVDPKTASPFAGYLAQAHINNAAAIVAGKADVTSLGVKARMIVLLKLRLSSRFLGSRRCSPGRRCSRFLIMSSLNMAIAGVSQRTWFTTVPLCLISG